MRYTTAGWLGDSLDRPRATVAASLARFAAAGLVVAALLTVLTGVLARRTGADEATRSFERIAAVVAGSVVAPRLTADLRRGDLTAQSEMGRAVEPLLLAGLVVRITVRDADGRVVWSDLPTAIGTARELRADQRRALERGSVVSAGGEQATGNGPAHLLTTSVGVLDAGGTPLLVEVSDRHGDMEQFAWDVWKNFAPASLGALLVLQLVQIPLAWTLARRIRRHQEAEASLLQTAVEASDLERRRIAAEVHDTVIPDLTALTYQLDATRLGAPGGAEPSVLLARTADGVRHSIAALRGLSMELSHTRLPAEGLGPGLAGLAERMEVGGTSVRIDATGLDQIPPGAAEVLYRCAQETLRNVSAHSGAEQVEISVVPAAAEVTMVVDDDGRGFDGARMTASEAEGHLGLRALGDLVGDAGGSLTASSAPGQGTRVVVRVPMDAAPVGVGVSR